MKTKFRVWNKLTKSFKASDGAYFIRQDGAVEWQEASFGGTDFVGRMAYSSVNYPLNEDYIVQLWTGLVDKTGKDIYEGDILLCTNRTTNKYAVVTWNEYQSAFLFEGRLAFDFLQFNDVEVCGNIFENPKLCR